MSDEGETASAVARQVVEGFVNWLYDECPIWPDEVPRERLVALWVATHDVPTRTEIAEAGEHVQERTES